MTADFFVFGHFDKKNGMNQTYMALFSIDPFIFDLLNKVQLTGAMYGMPESKVVLSGFSILLAKYKFCTKL